MAINTLFPGFGPALSHNFMATMSLPTTASFSRASSATYFSRDGILMSAPVNVPRFDYDPITGALSGLLLETTRTNLLLYSENFSVSSWTKIRSTVYSGSGVSPAGVNNAVKLIATSTSGDHFLAQPVSQHRNARYTFSIFAKAAEFSRIRLHILANGAAANRVSCRYDLVNGTTYDLRAEGDGAEASARVTPVGNGWFRCIISGVPSQSNAGVATEVLVSIINNSNQESGWSGNGNDGVLLFGAQLESAPFPTSYIPSGSSQATRGEDVFQFTGAGFTKWFNPERGTLLADFSVPYHSRTSIIEVPVFIVYGGSIANSMRLRWFSTADGQYHVDAIGVTGGVVSFDTSGRSFAPNNQRILAALAYQQGGDVVSCVNRYASTHTPSNGIPTVHAAQFGSNCHLRRIAYYADNLSESQLVAITTV